MSLTALTFKSTSIIKIISSIAIIFAFNGTALSKDLTTRDGLFALQGAWSGRGTSIVSNDPEKVSCRGSAIPKEERLQVVISCKATSGSGRLVAYIGLDDNTRAISGVWHQAFEGKQGQTRGKLTGTAKDGKTLAMLLNTYGKDRASVVFEQVGANDLRVRIRDITNGGKTTFDVALRR